MPSEAWSLTAMTRMNVDQLVAAGKLSRVLLPDCEVLRTRQGGTLEAVAFRLHELLQPLFAEDADSAVSTDSAAYAGTLGVVCHIMQHGFIGYGEAADLYINVCQQCLESFRGRHTLTQPSTSNRSRVALSLLTMLPVMKLPFRSSGQAGEAPAVLVPNVPSITAEDLPAHLYPMLPACVKLACDASFCLFRPGVRSAPSVKPL